MAIVRLTLVLLLLGLGAAPAMGAVTGSIQGTTLTISGDGADDTIAVAPSADTTRLEVDTNADGNPDLSFDRSLFDKTVVNAGAGNDAVTIASGTSTDGVSVDGGPGEDVVQDGDGGDIVHGGEGDDLLSGGRGNDTLFGDAGADTFTWTPGDGSDTMEGGDGVDRFVMTTANVSENVAVEANGNRVRVTRDVATIVHDLAGVDIIDLRLLGGNDTYTGGTGLADLVSSIIVNGGAGTDTLNGGDADETLIGGPDADTVSGGEGDDTFPAGPLDPIEAVDGGPGGDTIAVTGTDASEPFSIDAPAPGQASVTANFTPTPFVSGTAIEHVSLDAGAGNDSVALTPDAASALTVDLSGGPGDDTLAGGDGPDTLRGGDGNDRLFGGDGNDRLFGDLGNDALAGQAGADEFHCAGPTDTLDATAEDTVDADCIPLPVTPPPVTIPPDLVAPKLRVTGLPKSIARRRLLIHGLSFTVRPSEPAALQADLLARTRRAKLAAAPNLTLASRNLALSGSARRIRLKPSKRLIGRQRHFTLTVRIVATDASRNRSTTTRTVRVR